MGEKDFAEYSKQVDQDILRMMQAKIKAKVVPDPASKNLYDSRWLVVLEPPKEWVGEVNPVRRACPIDTVQLGKFWKEGMANIFCNSFNDHVPVEEKKFEYLLETATHAKVKTYLEAMHEATRDRLKRATDTGDIAINSFTHNMLHWLKNGMPE
jgi:hypothetical protein